MFVHQTVGQPSLLNPPNTWELNFTPFVRIKSRNQAAKSDVIHSTKTSLSFPGQELLDAA